MVNFYYLFGLFHLYAPSLAVIDGSKAAPGEFPWMAAIISREANAPPLCGGTLITKRTILTSTSCVANKTNSDLAVRVGSLYSTSGGVRLGIARTIRHPDYKTGSLINDVALLVTSSDVPIHGPSVETVTLANTPFPAGTAVQLVGWGATEALVGGSSSDELMYVDSTLQPSSSCTSSVAKTAVFCDSAVLGGSCTPDQGGPVMVGGQQVGIISAVGCGLADLPGPGVDASVSFLLPWIQSNKM